MAALAAIAILWPGHAAAAADACEQSGFWASAYPPLQEWISGSKLRSQLEFLLSPANWITALVMIWILRSNGTRPTIAAACWFAALGCFHALGYLSMDLDAPYYRAAIPEGCIADSPQRALVNFAFSVGAILLTLQRVARMRSKARGR